MLKKQHISFSWDFLDTRLNLAGKYLSENDRIGSSAIAGAVIETSLRKIVSLLNIPNVEQKQCPVCGMQLSNDKNLFVYLQKIKRVNLIDNQMLKLLDDCRKIRNTASHGYYGVLRMKDCVKILNTARMLINFCKKNFKL